MKDNKKCDWFSLTKKMASDIKQIISNATGLQNPKDTTNSNDSVCDFESCQELTFESIVSWIKLHMQEVIGCDSALVRREQNADNEDFKYKVVIYFLNGRKILDNEVHKVIMCNFLEDDLANSFNSNDIFIIK